MTLPKPPHRTTPGFAFAIVERALQEGTAKRAFGAEEIRAIVAFFSTSPTECVFCGSLQVKRWDHLVPVSKGGDTVLGNIVPACQKCDDSKGSAPFDVWMGSSAPNSPASRSVIDLEARIARIRGYREHFGYVPKQTEDRLTIQEQAP